MVINTQAFHARGEDARRMGMGLDDFQSRTGTRTTALVDHIAGIDDFELLAFLVVQKVER